MKINSCGKNNYHEWSVFNRKSKVKLTLSQHILVDSFLLFCLFFARGFVIKFHICFLTLIFFFYFCCVLYRLKSNFKFLNELVGCLLPYVFVFFFYFSNFCRLRFSYSETCFIYVYMSCLFVVHGDHNTATIFTIWNC